MIHLNYILSQISRTPKFKEKYICIHAKVQSHDIYQKAKTITTLIITRSIGSQYILMSHDSLLMNHDY